MTNPSAGIPRSSLQGAQREAQVAQKFVASVAARLVIGNQELQSAKSKHHSALFGHCSRVQC